MLAANQAPIILISQSRQSEKDRLNAEHDYEVNVKVELEIMLLHDKLDLLRENQSGKLLAIQTEQFKVPRESDREKTVAEEARAELRAPRVAGYPMVLP